MLRLAQSGASKVLIIAILLASEFAIAEVDSSSSLMLEISSKAVVTGSKVYLSDIAKCSGPTALCQEISGIDIAQSPAPGRTGYISKSSILAVLNKEWPGVVVNINGVDSSRVESPAVDLAIDDVRVKLHTLISTRLGQLAESVRVTIQKINPASAMTIRPTQNQFDFFDLDSLSFDDSEWIARNLVGSRLIGFRVVNPTDNDDRTILQVNVLFGVERRLPSILKPVSQGQVIQDSNVGLAWIPIRRGLQDYAVSKDAVVGRRSRQSLSVGEPLMLRYLEAPIAVNRNQVVMMIVKKGDLEITSRATAVDQGAVGQTVQVVNMATKLRMRARIIDEKTVEAVAF